MRKRFLYPLLAMIFYFELNISNAQTNTAEQKQGEITFQKNYLNYNTDNIPAVIAHQLKVEIGKVQNIVLQNPLLQPPTGFNAGVEEFVSAAPAEIPWQKHPGGQLVLGFKAFYLDNAAGSVKLNQEATSDMEININSFRNLYDKTYNEASPIFFFRYNWKMVDSTDEYYEIETTDKQPIRIISNGKPVFVPLTREQYLSYKIKIDKKNEDDGMQKYNYDNKTMADVPVKQKILDADKDLENTWHQKLNFHRQQLASMNAGEKNQPAYIIWGGHANPGDLEELTASSDASGQELWTINPDYFNKNLPLSAIQLITVQAQYPPQYTGFMLDKLVSIFHKTDYQKLKALIQH